jgi:hypothetical protein
MRIRRKKRMAEYIDKKQAIDRIASCYCIDCEHSNGILCRACEHQDDIDLIDEIPAADVQPVRRGRWLEHHAIWIDQPEIEGWFVQAKCSECEKWAHVMNPYTKSVDYECCPHCGARMKED